MTFSWPSSHAESYAPLGWKPFLSAIDPTDPAMTAHDFVDCVAITALASTTRELPNPFELLSFLAFRRMISI